MQVQLDLFVFKVKDGVMKAGSWGLTEYGGYWSAKSIPARFVLPVVNVPFEDFTVMVPRNAKQWFRRSYDFSKLEYPLPMPKLKDRYSHEGPVHSCAAPRQWQRYPHLFRGIEQQCQCNTQFNDGINTYPAVKHTPSYEYSEFVGNGTRRACVGACEHDYWVGDGICDAGNNNCGCWYDGGDCCGSLGGPKQYAHCGMACACADPTAAKHERMETGQAGRASCVVMMVLKVVVMVMKVVVAVMMMVGKVVRRW